MKPKTMALIGLALLVLSICATNSGMLWGGWIAAGLLGASVVFSVGSIGADKRRDDGR